MENWEVQEMKDDLVILGYGLKGTRENKTLKKAFDYINDLEKRIVEIAKDEDRAIKLLKENGYEVIKKTALKSLDLDDECYLFETLDDLVKMLENDSYETILSIKKKWKLKRYEVKL